MNTIHRVPSVESWIDAPDSALNAACRCIDRAGILIYPTETVYGIGGDARCEDVALRVADLKGRDRDKPMLLLTDEWDRVADWFQEVSDTHRHLMQHPQSDCLTILFEASPSAPVKLRGGSALIGVRRTGHPFCRALVRQSGAPLISTSANRSGEPVARTVREIPDDVRTGVDLVIEAGPSPSSLASTVVRVDDGLVRIVRAGLVAESEWFPAHPLTG